MSGCCKGSKKDELKACFGNYCGLREAMDTKVHEINKKIATKCVSMCDSGNHCHKATEMLLAMKRHISPDDIVATMQRTMQLVFPLTQFIKR